MQLEGVTWLHARNFYFWRCFASSFYRDPDGVLNELVEMLTRMGIEPVGKSETSRPERRFTEHRTIKPVAAEQPSSPEVGGIDLDGLAAVPFKAANQIRFAPIPVAVASDPSCMCVE